MRIKVRLMRTKLGTRPGTTSFHSLTTDTDPNFHSLYTDADPPLFAYEPITTVSETYTALSHSLTLPYRME